ncbi:hypothetical protein [Agrobacterium larrymoorei]|nr:hypothetical protein [Agrobacterium larrymoorei]
MENTAISVEVLNHSFGQLSVLENISFDVKRGEVVARGGSENLHS